jgi:thioredoxin 1
VKVNTDENISIASQYRIMSIPTLGIFKNGKLVDAVIGAVPKSQLVSKINPYLVAVN